MALALPEAVERDHHGIPSYRVKGRIFSTLWDPQHVNIMLDPWRIEDIAQRNPGSCKEIFWGDRLSCVQLDLDLVDKAFIEKLLREAWERKAKK
jgi:YjbR